MSSDVFAFWILPRKWLELWLTEIERCTCSVARVNWITTVQGLHHVDVNIFGKDLVLRIFNDSFRPVRLPARGLTTITCIVVCHETCRYLGVWLIELCMHTNTMSSRRNSTRGKHYVSKLLKHGNSVVTLRTIHHDHTSVCM